MHTIFLASNIPCIEDSDIVSTSYLVSLVSLALRNFSEMDDMPSSATAVSPPSSDVILPTVERIELPPLPAWKWPLTHQERICELEAYIQDNENTPFKIRIENVKAAIEYHKTFPKDEYCSVAFTYFQSGEIRQKKDLTVAEEPHWREVSNIFNHDLSIHDSSAKILFRDAQ